MTWQADMDIGACQMTGQRCVMDEAEIDKTRVARTAERR